MRLVNRHMACVSLFVIGAAPLWTQAASDLVADEFLYNRDNNTVEAIGNVEIFSSDTRYFVDNIIYNLDTEQVDIPGQIKIVFPDDTVIVSSRAALDLEANRRIVEAARIQLPNALQIAASEIRDDEDYTYFYNGIASSCRVCFTDSVPLWQLRASKAIQDKAEGKIFFENARFEAFGIPLSYSPTFRIPPPVSRGWTGFTACCQPIECLRRRGGRLPYFTLWATIGTSP